MTRGNQTVEGAGDQAIGSGAVDPAPWRHLLRPLLMAAVLGTAGWFLIERLHYVTDFTVYWTAARNAWGSVYDLHAMTQAQAWVGDSGPRPFAYPPTFLLLILPFGWLSLRAAFALWVAVSAAAFVEAGARLEPRWPILLVASVLGVETWAAGQATLLAGAALFFGLSLLERPRLAGVFFGLALAIKPHIVIAIVPALMIWRIWPALLTTALSWGLPAAVSAMVFGPDIWPRWLAAAAELGNVAVSMPQVVGISLGWGLHGPPYIALRLAGVIAAAWLVWRTRRGPPLARLLAVAGGSLLCSPYVMRYEVVLLAPIAIGFLFSRSWRIAPGLGLLLGLILVWWLMVAFVATAAIGGAKASSPLQGTPRRTRLRAAAPEEAATL